jgi:hypothetical protein
MKTRVAQISSFFDLPPSAITYHGGSHRGASGWVVIHLCAMVNRDHWLFPGLRLEGVYRKGGARARSLRLLAEFRRDARSVKLRPGEHFVEDVTDTLKRFFRELDDPVTSARLLPRWREAAGTTRIPKNQGPSGISLFSTRIHEALLWDWAAFLVNISHPGQIMQRLGSRGSRQAETHPS